MDSSSGAQMNLAASHAEYLPHLSVDCAIFGFHDGELKILLLKWKHVGGWSLPGGFIRRDEPLDDAAHRILAERTGLDRIYLQQCGAFGGTNRKESTLKAFFDGMGIEVSENFPFFGRVVSIGYYALVDYRRAAPTLNVFAEDVRWWDSSDRPPLLFDHEEIVARALETLRTQLHYRPIGLNLLPEKFTMPELQRLYEAVLGKPLDRRNFQKRILDLGVVVRLPERKTGGAHRAPYLYRFDRDKYEAALGLGLS